MGLSCRVALLVAAGALFLPELSQAARMFGGSPKTFRKRDLTVCFADRHLPHYTSAQIDEIETRIDLVTESMRELEKGVNVRFHVLAGNCLPDANGNYQEDIRIALQGTEAYDYFPTGRSPENTPPLTFSIDGWIVNNRPIRGCDWNEDQPGWIRRETDYFFGPGSASALKKCAWTGRLSQSSDPNDTGLDDPRHYLHEFGHALGLAHEFDRMPNPVTCEEEYPGLFPNLTPIDYESMMAYAWSWHQDVPECVFNQVYDPEKGPSRWDWLALQFLYPEEGNPSEFTGRRVIPTSAPIRLEAAWRTMGLWVDNPSTVSQWEWRVDGLVYSTNSRLDLTSAQYADLRFVRGQPSKSWTGSHEVTLRYRDLEGRWFARTRDVEVLSATNFKRRAGAIAASRLTVM